MAKYRGKVVLIQYWATWSAPAKADMATLKELWNKYGRSFVIIGVSLDNNVKDLNAYLAENPLPWPQIYEEGGLDSRPANALGILTVPTMILVDQQGQVVSRNMAIADVESEVKKAGQIGRIATDESATDGCLVYDPGDGGSRVGALVWRTIRPSPGCDH